MHMLWGRSFEWKGKCNSVSSVSIQCVSSCSNWITCQGELLILDVAIWSTGVYGDRTERDKASDNECIRADLSFTWTQPFWPFWNTTGVADPFLRIRRMELYFVINSHLKVQTSQVVNLDLTALSNEATYVAAVVVPFASCCETCVYIER